MRTALTSWLLIVSVRWTFWKSAIEVRENIFFRRNEKQRAFLDM